MLNQRKGSSAAPALRFAFVWMTWQFCLPLLLHASAGVGAQAVLIHEALLSNSAADMDALGAEVLERDLNLQDAETGQTPLMMAALAGADKVVELLLAKRADHTIGENAGFTPFHGAAFGGHVAVAKHLLAHRLNPSDYAADGYTPLHRACWGKEDKHTDLVRFLFANGVDPGELSGESPEERVMQGQTCRQLATHKKTLALFSIFDAVRTNDAAYLEILPKLDEVLNLKNPEDGQTPLFTAVVVGADKAVEFLLA